MHSYQYILFPFILITAVLASGCQTNAAGISASEGGVLRVSDFVEHGVPAPVARHRGAIATRDPNGNPVLLAWLSTATDTALLKVDLATGQSEQFRLPERIAGRSFLLTDRGQFYFYGDSKLLVYDINENKLDTIEGPGRFGYAIAEGNDGTVYIALNPHGDLLAYDPDTRELNRVARVRVGSMLQYPRRLAVDSEDWIYVGVVQANTIVAYNPQSGEQKVVAEHSDHPPGGMELFRGVDGAVYARPSHRLGHENGWVRVLAGKVTELDGTPEVEEAAIKHGNHMTVYDDLGEGMTLVELNVADLSPHVVIAVEGEDQPQRIDFGYKTDGPSIFSITEGADSRIYGSTGHPRYLFAYDPDSGDFRAKRMPGGHLNAMAAQGDYIFGALYSSGELHKIDPAKPWDDGGINPSLVVMARTPEGMIARPYMLLAHPDGKRVVMGGFYDFSGLAGGGLVIYDQKTEALVQLSIDDLLPGHSARAACVTADGNLLVGTTVGTRGRAEPTADEAVLYVLDMDSYKVIGETTVAPGIQAVRDMVYLPELDTVIGLADPTTLFEYDPATAEIVHREDFSGYGAPTGSQAPRIMAEGPDGAVYILFESNIVRYDPLTRTHAVVGEPPVNISTGIIVSVDRLYFTSGSSLWSGRFNRDGVQHDDPL